MNLELCLFALALLPQSSSDNEFAWGDFNADGLLDLVVAVDGAPKLFQNSGNGAFVDRSKELGLSSLKDAHFGLWKDLDGDGYPELLIGRSHGVTLFHNERGRALTDVTEVCGLGALEDEVLLANWVDYDADGLQDLELRTRTRGLLYHGAGTKKSDHLLELELVASGALPGTQDLSVPQVGASGGTPIVPGSTSNGHANSIVSGGCASRILDFANPAACLSASSVPQIGMLYPISQELYVDSATGFVGIGVTDPSGRLDVAGMIRIRSEGLEFPDGTMQTTAQLVGPAGPTGPAGAPGADGNEGAPGANGSDGAAGPQGPTGPAGAPGADGDEGVPGADGNEGAPGANGSDGAAGPQGPTGPAGAPGADGNEGTPGANGSDGAAGPQGPTGPAGSPGADGNEGAAGQNSQNSNLIVFGAGEALLSYGNWVSLWINGTHAQSQGLDTPFNHGAFLGPGRTGAPINTAYDDGGVWVVPFDGYIPRMKLSYTRIGSFLYPDPKEYHVEFWSVDRENNAWDEQLYIGTFVQEGIERHAEFLLTPELSLEMGDAIAVRISDAAPVGPSSAWEGPRLAMSFGVSDLDIVEGPPGADGSAGPQGPTGSVGPQGPDGATGPQGPTGPAGTPGADGDEGAQGADGNEGATGPQGPTGPAGTSSWTEDAGSVSTSSDVLIGGSGSPALGSVQVLGDATEGVMMISPNVAASGANSEIWLAEDNDGTYRMGWRYDGGTNRMHLVSSVNGIESDPALTVLRDAPLVGVGVPLPAYTLDVAGTVNIRSGSLRFPDGTLQSTAQLEGPAGSDGAQGPAGPTGSAGSDGSQGPAGSDGAQGPDGPPGSDGAPGPMGPIGPTGPAGPAGGSSSWTDGTGSVTTMANVGIGTTNLTGALTVVNNGRAIQASSTNDTPSLFITGGSDAKTVGEAGMLQLGSTNTENMVIDGNEILARYDGATSPLYLQLDGGLLDVGGPLKLRDSLVLEDTTGGSTKKVKFTVKQSSGLLEDDDDDVVVTSEDDDGNEEGATISTRGLNIPPKTPDGVVVSVRGGTGGVSEDPLLIVSSGIQIADESGNTSAFMPTSSGGLRLGNLDGPQVDIDVTDGGGIDVKGSISGANIIASSLDLGENSSFGLNEVGQLDLQSANGFAFSSGAQQVNFNISNTGVLGFNNEFGENSVLQIGSEVESGGLVIRDGLRDLSIAVDDQESGAYADYLSLDEEIERLVAIDTRTPGATASLGISINGLGVAGYATNAGTPLAGATIGDDTSSKVFSLAHLDSTTALVREVMTVLASGETIITTNGVVTDGLFVDSYDPNANPTANYHYGLQVMVGNGSNPRGVWGRVLGTPSAGSQAIKGTTSGNGPGHWAVYAEGDLGATGVKSFIQPHPEDPSKQIRFACLEGNESGTYCRGTAQIVDGVCTIDLPEDFRLASEEGEITAQLTALGGPVSIWVESQSRDQIVVRGTNDISFNWFVNGVRRGFSQFETITKNTSFIPGESEVFGEPVFPQFNSDYRRILVENGTLNADFTPNMETAARLGWIPEEPEVKLSAEALKAQRRSRLIEQGLLDQNGLPTTLLTDFISAKSD